MGGDSFAGVIFADGFLGPSIPSIEGRFRELIEPTQSPGSYAPVPLVIAVRSALEGAACAVRHFAVHQVD